MTRFLLIRHGDNDTLGKSLAGRADGIHLNQHGREQALELAEALRDVPIDAVYSSPLERCLETARPLAEILDLTIHIEPAVSEVHFGDWTGSTFEALNDDPVWKAWNSKRSSTRPPGGECMQEVQDRFLGQLAAWGKRYPLETVAVFSHSDPIKAVVLHCRQASLDTMLEFAIDPASVTILDWEGDRHELKTINATPAQAARALETRART